MKFEQTCTIAASRADVWAFLMNMENVAACLQGVRKFEAIDDDHYEGILRIKVGPVSISFQGLVVVETRDREQWLGVIRAEAKDRKVGGGVNAHLHMSLVEKSPAETEMRIVLDTHLLGKIGEFGQPLIRKKTDDLIQNFAAEVSKQLSAK
jgi:carbon monoxide dehydrogenase subunit G